MANLPGEMLHLPGWQISPPHISVDSLVTTGFDLTGPCLEMMYEGWQEYWRTTFDSGVVDGTGLGMFAFFNAHVQFVGYLQEPCKCHFVFIGDRDVAACKKCAKLEIFSIFSPPS